MKTLICINTCDRVSNIKAFLGDYINFVNSKKEFDIVVSLDGSDEKTINYCNEFNIPLVYSDNREGVGLSKNRVLELFKNYDYYFFIEDDVELLNTDVFNIHIELANKLNIHHFSLFENSRIRNIIEKTSIGKYTIIHSLYGSAQVNFFTKIGLEKVGGFHTLFAKYKRFGHTEHTYRFVNANLNKYPFNIIEDLIDNYFRWNDPISVTKIKVTTTQNRLFEDEEKLIEKKLEYFPLKTISKYYLLNKNTTPRYDIKSNNYKKQFYFNLALLNFIRTIKRNTIGLFR